MAVGWQGAGHWSSNEANAFPKNAIWNFGNLQRSATSQSETWLLSSPSNMRRRGNWRGRGQAATSKDGF